MAQLNHSFYLNKKLFTMLMQIFQRSKLAMVRIQILFIYPKHKEMYEFIWSLYSKRALLFV